MTTKGRPVPGVPQHSQSNEASASTFNEYDDLDERPPSYDASISPGPFVGPSHYQQAPNPAGAYPPYPAQNHYAQPTSPFSYPPGYVCPYCRNTGVKLHNGSPCGSCERMFGRQNVNVMYAPSHVVQPGAITYMAGDPRIGGRLCGNCKGRGARSSFFGLMDEQCMFHLHYNLTCRPYL